MVAGLCLSSLPLCLGNGAGYQLRPKTKPRNYLLCSFQKAGGAGQLSTNIRRARLITYTRVNSSRLTPAHASKWEKRQEEASDLNNPILGASCSRSGTHVPPLLSTYGKTLIPGTKHAGPLRLFTASYLAYAGHDRSLGLSFCVRNGMSNSLPTMVMDVGSGHAAPLFQDVAMPAPRMNGCCWRVQIAYHRLGIQSQCFSAWYALPRGRLSRTLLPMCPKTPYHDRLLVTASARFSYDEL